MAYIRPRYYVISSTMEELLLNWKGYHRRVHSLEVCA